MRTATAHTFVSRAALTVPCVQSDRETFAFTDERRGLQGTNRGGPTPVKCLLPERFPKRVCDRRWAQSTAVGLRMPASDFNSGPATVDYRVGRALSSLRDARPSGPDRA